MMRNAYDNFLLITIGLVVALLSEKNQTTWVDCDIKTWLHQKLPLELREEKKSLAVFKNLDLSLDKIDDVENEIFLGLVNAVVNIQGPKVDGEKVGLSHISPEDIGGIHEAFSGYIAEWSDGEIIFSHNENRRSAGKIYTPYDVTNHITNKSIDYLFTRVKSIDELKGKIILDPAVGSGAFLAQFIRNLFLRANRKKNFAVPIDFKHYICEKMLYAIDIDPYALDLTRVVLWLECDSPTTGLGYNFSNTDSLTHGNGMGHSIWKGINESAINKFDVVIGNPPYVRAGKNPDFKSSNANNLFAFFVELGINLLSSDGYFNMIVPLNIINSRECLVLRELIFAENCYVAFQNFDSVPDFLFDQGKIEENSNTNITQRTTILTINKSRSSKIMTSKLLRWRRTEERNLLFENISLIVIPKNLILDVGIPMIGNIDDKKLLIKLRRNSLKTIANHLTKGEVNLWMPKAIRYFNTAAHYDLNRKNCTELSFSERDFPIAHVLLNSNLFYWWWRVHGNGFQIEKRDIESFPWLPISHEEANRLSGLLIKAANKCRVIKRNAGKDIPNINYNYAHKLLLEIDDILLASIGETPHSEIFGIKTNSLFGDMSKLRGYNSV
jgi:hypothetical protein